MGAFSFVPRGTLFIRSHYPPMNRWASALESERAQEGESPSLAGADRPVTESNCVLATGRGEQLEVNG
jgi:hypothetical protein